MSEIFRRVGVIGVLNATPDSFSDGGRFVGAAGVDLARGIDLAAEMEVAGASVIDVGGESTRPGATAVDEQEEIERVVPVIEAVSRRLDVLVSVDTCKPLVMREAVAAGARLVNDVYALRSEGALEEAARLDVAVCLMHMRGEPGTMQENPQYEDVAGEIAAFLTDRVRACEAAGVGRERIVIDPGFGFGKTDKHNIRLLAELSRLRVLGLPLLVGLSRKRTLGNLTGRPVEDRVSAGLAAAVLAVERGAHIVRTHDVGPTVDALAVAAAVMRRDE
jgi:dihydropteroate synthase